MELDLITYGNPTIEQIPYLESQSYLDELLPELKTYTFPKNSSEATKEELNQLVDYLKTVNGKNEFLSRYKGYDRSLRKSFSDFFLKDVEDKDEIVAQINDIITDVSPLIMKLKFYFQRPRPYQLSQYYKLKLFPYESRSADSPSFPSGHAYLGRIITEVIGNHKPQTYALMQKILNDICYSRVYLGLHYQSDIDVGIFCADKVLSNKQFKEKYKL